MWSGNDTTGSYQRLDLFMKVLWLFCPNLTDSSAVDHFLRTLLTTAGKQESTILEPFQCIRAPLCLLSSVRLELCGALVNLMAVTLGESVHNLC